MICEDDPDLLLVYRLALRSKYDIVGVKSGRECIERYGELKNNKRKIDALLLDFRLPDATGDKIAREIRRMDGTRVILISAYEIDDHVVNTLKSEGNIVTFLKKPISILALSNSLESVLGS